MPSSLYSAIDTAEDLRELKEIGLLPTIQNLTSWEVCCFRVAEAATREIDAEEIAKAEKGRDKDGKFIGQNNPEFAKIEPDGAFAAWDKIPQVDLDSTIE